MVARSRTRCTLVALLATLAAAACGPGRGAQPTASFLGGMSPAEQRDAFLRLCASCHGRDGRGDGPVANDLRVPPTDLGLLAVRNGGAFPRDRIRDTLTGVRAVRAHGPPDMPVWAERLSTSESPAVVAVAFERARLVTGLLDHLASLQRPGSGGPYLRGSAGSE
jgi:hypothetical protein